MFKKIYEKFKTFISENCRELILILGFYVFMTYPLPYFILVSGGTIDVSDRVDITEEYQQKGSFNLAYVNELRGTLPTVILSHIIPDWTLYKEEDYAFDEDENTAEIVARDRFLLSESMQNATKVAYEAADKDFSIKNEEYYIYYVYNFVKEYSLLRVGDKLISYDGMNFDDIEIYREYVQNKEVGDEIEITFERNGQKKDTILKVYEEDGQKYTGFQIFPLLEYETDPEIKFHFSKNESGSSGGLTIALAIYNKLTKEDITNGLKIVGTGTIDQSGTVGAIGGVEYKLAGAVKAKADVFIVPTGDNYETVKNITAEKGYKIKIIEATTFQQTVKDLQEYTKSVK